MNYYRTATVADVLNTLKAYRNDLQDPPLRKPHWPLLERLIFRETEMTSVWDNIARQGLSWQQCHTLLEQIFFAGAYGTKERNTRLKVDQRRLVDLNLSIAAKATELATMLTEREDIINRNAFSVERTSHIVDLIDRASEQNGHYSSFLREPLDGLRYQYDAKYWPSLQQLLQVAACETPEAEFLHLNEQAIVAGRGKTVPDYLRELFKHIEIARNSHWRLPADFTLTDSSLATLATVSLDLDEIVTADRVKTLRHRLNKDGYPGAWATPKEASL
ncbi:Uncharacterised protein [Serratia ficaria]|uniref:hypothetical protein n=1 Tax=Enterobacterales TaxID=91347 RepID=UPI001D0DB9DE|nr:MULTISPECIES: hypothetical protein [Enterobacterales]CAI1969701.1 Uncharacterised protein [Serratia ficaria]